MTVVQQKVLVVDDPLDAADLLAELLRASGQGVRTACDGASALEVASAFGPDVALSDLGLPGMDGWQLAGHLRGLPGQDRIRLVALGGYAADLEPSRAAGFDAHVVKSAGIEQIEAAIAMSA